VTRYCEITNCHAVFDAQHFSKTLGTVNKTMHDALDKDTNKNSIMIFLLKDKIAMINGNNDHLPLGPASFSAPESRELHRPGPLIKY